MKIKYQIAAVLLLLVLNSTVLTGLYLSQNRLISPEVWPIAFVAFAQVSLLAGSILSFVHFTRYLRQKQGILAVIVLVLFAVLCYSAVGTLGQVTATQYMNDVLLFPLVLSFVLFILARIGKIGTLHSMSLFSFILTLFVFGTAHLPYLSLNSEWLEYIQTAFNTNAWWNLSSSVLAICSLLVLIISGRELGSLDHN